MQGGRRPGPQGCIKLTTSKEEKALQHLPIVLLTAIIKKEEIAPTGSMQMQESCTVSSNT